MNHLQYSYVKPWRWIMNHNFHKLLVEMICNWFMHNGEFQKMTFSGWWRATLLDGAGGDRQVGFLKHSSFQVCNDLIMEYIQKFKLEKLVTFCWDFLQKLCHRILSAKPGRFYIIEMRSASPFDVVALFCRISRSQ